MSALRTSAVAHIAAAPCCCGAGHAAIDRYLLPAGLTVTNMPHAAEAGEWFGLTDRQMNRQMDGHYTVA